MATYGTFASGQVLTAAELNTIGNAWTTYTCTWSGTIGNGTNTARYLAIGKTVHFRITITWGSTTSHGAATQTFTLPTSAHSDYVVNFPIGTGQAVDTGTQAYGCTAMMYTATNTIFLQRDSNNTAVSNTAPITFGSTDQILISGTYETA